MCGIERMIDMAYNNGFPMGYQPAVYYPQYTLPQVQNQNQNQNNSIIWVQGEAGAKSYLVAPNTTVQLWDSENQVIYLKSADASGMPSMRVLEYKIRDTAERTEMPLKATEQYATKVDLAELEKRLVERFSDHGEGAEK